MRCGIVLAAALIVMPAIAMSATGGQATEWCGSASHDDAVVECGYTTAADCETAVGKGGMCFVDPDVAFNTKRVTPASTTKIPPRG
ncbi:MAG: DUF3551 domain-containing protein [Xanthobacteraceae bacterium]|jgi:hypothetical protein